MDFQVYDIPAQAVPRCRTIKFDHKTVAIALRAYCQARGISISDACKVSIGGVPIGTLTLIIKGD